MPLSLQRPHRRRIGAAVGAAVLGGLLLGGPASRAREPRAPAPAATIIAYHDSGEWDRDTSAAIARASRLLAAGLRRTGGRPALVLDVDDTSLSSYDCLKRANFLRAAARACIAAATLPAIPQTLRFYRDARRRHVTVFFITGRRESSRRATRTNLERQGYTAGWRLLMRPDGPRRGTNATYKASQRRRVTRRGFRVLVNVGDQKTDLVGGHARANVKVPNPMYVTR